MLYIQLMPYNISEKYVTLAWWVLIMLWSGYYIWKGFIEEVLGWRNKNGNEI
jgi:hypothetical protein